MAEQSQESAPQIAPSAKASPAAAASVTAVQQQIAQRNNLNTAQTAADGTGQNKVTAQTGVTNANDAVANNTDNGFSASTAQSNRDRAETQNTKWMFDFTGQGPTDLHGHNKGAGVTGAGGDLVRQLGEQAIAEGMSWRTRPSMRKIARSSSKKRS